ncbi:DUF4231 domain-containing protein [Nonomuraea dietziae]|uniref:DUF4231 domain-containing protein n=1 Tax=Nonomuraea dietziae TaxID=65515 RepID=UPI0033F4E207
MARQIIQICFLSFIASLVTYIGIRQWVRKISLESRLALEKDVDRIREDIRWLEASNVVEATVHQQLYKADIAAIVAQYQSESEKYRKIHNRLQSLIIIGSLSTTTAAALEAALPGHRWITVILSFLVGLAAGFMGYFKFRERSFYLQQTSDAIEQEANAMILRVGDYKGLDTPGALTLLVERVESFRNEQRRRQQQLDQPVDERAVGPSE